MHFFWYLRVEMDEERYIRVILPLKLSWEPCYRTSEEVRTGMRVNVTFSGRKYTGVVCETDVVPDVDAKRILPVNAVERHMEAIGEKELALWRFMSDYYLCTIGEVYKQAYPAAKTAGEEVRARAEERRELMKARTEELYRKRIRGLEERLARKEAALSGKHNAKVTAELESGRDRILEELKGLRKKLDETGIAEQEQEITDDSPFAALRMSGGDNGDDGMRSVETAFAAGKTVLLQGGAARIGVILGMARETLVSGRSVLMLVPEISLSKKLQTNLRETFGSAVLVFHSGESAGNRREVATALRRGDRPRLVLGTRSALFLPFRDLGLVIVEEEHDIAYKQDGTPRYGAHDTAVMLGSIHGASVLLSSPTPSLESLYNCLSGRYVLVRTPLEESAVEIVDTSVEARKNGMVGDLSRILIALAGETLKSGGKVLILRPWGPFDDLEEQVGKLFPEHTGRVLFSSVHDARRMDLEGIALLALLNADTLMDKNDFRADEKAMQTLEQFRGRLSGHMLVQTRQGNHPVFLMGEDYSLRLLEERRAFNFPPYSRMIDIIVRDGNAARLAKLSALLAGRLGAFGPEGPFAPRRGREPARDVLIIRIMLPKDRKLPISKKEIAAIIGDFEQSCKYTGHITLDVDPI